MQEISYIGYGRSIFTTLFNGGKSLPEWLKIVKKPDENTVIITDTENSLRGKKFAYALILNKKTHAFIKYIFTQPAPFPAKPIMANSLYNPLNPPVIIQEIENFNVIRDDLLPGGTKQRAIIPFLKEKLREGFTEIAYAGPAQGVAQAALGTAAKILNFSAHMFFSGRRGPISHFTEEIGVHMHPIAGPLKECQETAIKWAAADKKRFLLPFGLRDENFQNMLVAALKQSFPILPENFSGRSENISQGIAHMWVVGGSAVLLNCLYSVFPTTFFHVIQVGRAITMDMIDPARTQIFVHPEKFNMPANLMPPYNSVDNYDAKVWFYAKKYGRPGDFIWNVAG
jgi:hypothetical protein